MHKMAKFRYLPHTADMRFRSYGTDFRHSLENAALALLNTMLDIKGINADKSKESRIIIRESADTEEELAWFTLQDILSKVDSRKLNAYSFKINSIERKKRMKLSGVLHRKLSKKDFSMLSVKAVTPHDLKVERKNGITSIQVVIDV